MHGQGGRSTKADEGTLRQKRSTRGDESTCGQGGLRERIRVHGGLQEGMRCTGTESSTRRDEGAWGQGGRSVGVRCMRTRMSTRGDEGAWGQRYSQEGMRVNVEIDDI